MKSILKKNWDVVIVFFLMFCIFFFVVFFAVSDMSDHAYFARVKLKERDLFSGNFLMYLLINLFSGFLGTIHSTKAALVGLLSVSNTAKYVIVRDEFAKICAIRYSKIAALALLFVYIVPVMFFLSWFGVLEKADYYYFYLGNGNLNYFVPNVWHNSTLLCLMPFALLSYLLSVQQLESYDKKRNYFITLFVALGTMVKPSFFFIYAVAYPIVLYTRYRFSREFFYSLIPVLVGLLCVLYQYLTIYDGEGESSVVIDVLPLFTVAFWQSHWPYLLVSLALPIIFLFLYNKKIFREREFWFLLVMLVVALGINWCCNETGERADHRNFNWQTIVAMWFVFFYMLKTVLKTIFGDNGGKQSLSCGMLTLTNKIFIGLYGVHVLMGIIYLGRYLITKWYT
jgi:hypothetical protein